MDRAETTEMLNWLLEKRLNNITSYWASEVNINTDRTGRVDYMALMAGNIHSCENIEQFEGIEFWFYEVKSCMADFKSGHGLNFEGDRNFLVTTQELAQELYRKQMLPSEADVLVPNSSNTAFITAFHGSVEGPFNSIKRKKPALNLMFQMLQAYKNGRGNKGVR